MREASLLTQDIRIISAGAAVYGDFACPRPIRLVARTLQSPCAPVLAGCPAAAGRTSPQQQNHSLRKHIKEGPNTMSGDSKTQDWSKPAAMAIPKGGFFEDKVEQGAIVRLPAKKCEKFSTSRTFRPHRPMSPERFAIAVDGCRFRRRRYWFRFGQRIHAKGPNLRMRPPRIRRPRQTTRHATASVRSQGELASP
jgi:hypothetical protein